MVCALVLGVLGGIAAYLAKEGKTVAVLGLVLTPEGTRPEIGDLNGNGANDSGEPGANEIRFEDKGGEEEIYVHAERDMNTRIRFKETHHVGCDQTIDIGNDRTETSARATCGRSSGAASRHRERSTPHCVPRMTSGKFEWRTIARCSCASCRSTRTGT